MQLAKGGIIAAPQEKGAMATVRRSRTPAEATRTDLNCNAIFACRFEPDLPR
jgi:hypothetical protein